MALIEFSRFSFQVDGNQIHATYGKRYRFTTPLEEFTSIDSNVVINMSSIDFPNTSEKSADNKLNRILENGLRNMTHLLNGKKIIFIDGASEIPLVGSSEFGIIDRNTNVLELKPLTGCNLNCIYCSVDEGVNKKTHDVLIDPEYLVAEATKLAQNKTHPVEFNIGPHGEPLLYPFLEDLLQELSTIPNCEVISINTNGTLLTTELIDTLHQAGLTRINLSLNSLDETTNNTLSGRMYPTQKVLEMVAYAQRIGLAVLLAPLIVPGHNDNPTKDIAPLVSLAKTINSHYPTIGFQKFLLYKGGRNPVSEVSFEAFHELLTPFETEDFILTPHKDYNPFKIYEDKTVDKPLHKNDVVKMRIVAPGREKNERLCVAANRVITVRGLYQDKGTAKIKIVRDKHNIYLGVPA
ncbi:radical SAM protein [Candidatus Woesearchaeota archaeon]|nr:radical SAM protein [Candidatus Woesearchaeota archaeon]